MNELMNEIRRAAYQQATVNVWTDGDPIHGHIIGIHGDDEFALVTLLDHNLDLNRHVQVAQIRTFIPVGA